MSDSPEDDRLASSTDWVLLARDPRVFDDPKIAVKLSVRRVCVPPGLTLFTRTPCGSASPAAR